MTLTKRNPTTQLTAEMAIAIFKRQYPGVPEPEIMKAGMICYAYGLFPYANQVFIIPFRAGNETKWITVIGIKGLRQIVQNTGHSFSYIDGPRVMTEQEEIETYGARDPNYIRAIVKMKNRAGDIFPGYGNWRKADTAYGQDKGNTPHNMAFIRAERAALDKLAPGSLPDADVGDSRFVDAPPQMVFTAGEKELAMKAESDAVELWTDGKPTKINEILTPPADPVDMFWLKESLEAIKANNPGKHLTLLNMLKGYAAGRKYETWSEAVALLDKDQAALFCKAVQTALDNKEVP